MKRVILLGIVAAFALSSCPTNMAPAPGPARGSIAIALPLIALHDPKILDPADVYSYGLQGAGPGTESFQRDGITAQTVTIDSLSPGDWKVEIDGKNAGGSVVSSATVSATVVEGKTVSTEIEKSQFVSSGSLSISLAWLADLKETLVGASLTPANGSAAALALPAPTVVKGMETINTTITVLPGYYVLSRVFETAGGSQVGGADTLRVLPGDLTSFSLAADASGVTMSIAPDTSNAIPIQLSSVKGTYGKGQTIAVTATIPSRKGLGPVAVQWYLNGSLLSGQSDTTVLLSGLDAGRYRLDCIATAGSVLGSAAVAFSVTGGP